MSKKYKKKIFCQCHQHFRLGTTFARVNPKSIKRYRQLDWILTLLGALRVNAVRKYVGEIDPCHSYLSSSFPQMQLSDLVSSSAVSYNCHSAIIWSSLSPSLEACSRRPSISLWKTFRSWYTKSNCWFYFNFDDFKCTKNWKVCNLTLKFKIAIWSLRIFLYSKHFCTKKEIYESVLQDKLYSNI